MLEEALSEYRVFEELDLENTCMTDEQEKARFVKGLEVAEERRRAQYKQDVAALGPAERRFWLELSNRLLEEKFQELERMDLEGKGPGAFIRGHAELFANKKARDQFVKWADWAGVDEFIRNLQLQNSSPRRLRGIKVAFALLDNAQFSSKWLLVRGRWELFGARIGLGFGRGKPVTNTTPGRTEPEYQMGVGDVDAFFARLFPLCRLNPKAYFSILSSWGRQVLTEGNAESKGWLM
jgi:hypothetical protein